MNSGEHVQVSASAVGREQQKVLRWVQRERVWRQGLKAKENPSGDIKENPSGDMKRNP
jgi:hypothetical protein